MSAEPRQPASPRLIESGNPCTGDKGFLGNECFEYRMIPVCGIYYGRLWVML